MMASLVGDRVTAAFTGGTGATRDYGVPCGQLCQLSPLPPARCERCDSTPPEALRSLLHQLPPMLANLHMQQHKDEVFTTIRDLKHAIIKLVDEDETHPPDDRTITAETKNGSSSSSSDGSSSSAATTMATVTVSPLKLWSSEDRSLVWLPLYNYTSELKTIFAVMDATLWDGTRAVPSIYHSFVLNHYIQALFSDDHLHTESPYWQHFQYLLHAHVPLDMHRYQPLVVVSVSIINGMSTRQWGAGPPLLDHILESLHKE